MRKTIYISCLLKDNMIIAYHVSSNKKTIPSDYYKDFYYSGTSMENCNEIYKVEYMSIEFEDKEDSNFNNYIFEEVAKEFYKQWDIHPEHWGRPAYDNKKNVRRNYEYRFTTRSKRDKYLCKYNVSKQM